MAEYFKKETQELTETEPAMPAQQASGQAVSFCYACGERIPVGDAFCGKCGRPKRSPESQRKAAQALQQQEQAAQEQAEQYGLGNPIAILEAEGVDAAMQAMTAAYYQGRKAQISQDGAAILGEIYRPYMLSPGPKPRSADGRRVRALGQKLDALEGWLGMSKAYEYYRKQDPVHVKNIAELWSGIGDWAT